MDSKATDQGEHCGPGDGEITREELVVAIRTLLAAAACWEYRDATTTARDKKQQKALRKALNALQELNAGQAKSACRIIGTMARDEIATALGAKTTMTNRGPRMGERDAKSKSKPAALWAHLGLAAQIPNDKVASAISRAATVLSWVLGRETRFIDPTAAKDLARQIHAAQKENGQGPIEAAALVAFVFDDSYRAADGGPELRAPGTLEVAMAAWLLSECHPERADLGLENLDTGRYFGARDSPVRQPDAPSRAGPLESAAVTLAADAMGLAGDSLRMMLAATNATYPAVWLRAMRGAAGAQIAESALDHEGIASRINWLATCLFGYVWSSCKAADLQTL